MRQPSKEEQQQILRALQAIPRGVVHRLVSCLGIVNDIENVLHYDISFDTLAGIRDDMTEVETIVARIEGRLNHSSHVHEPFIMS